MIGNSDSAGRIGHVEPPWRIGRDNMCARQASLVDNCAPRSGLPEMAYSKASRAAGKLFHKFIFRKEKEKKNDV